MGKHQTDPMLLEDIKYRICEIGLRTKLNVVAGILGILAKKASRDSASSFKENRSFLGWYSCSKMNPPKV